MVISVRVQNAPKPDGITAAQVSMEKDLKSCMRCKFFYGNNSQCIIKECVKKDSKPEITEQDKKHICFGCPYRQSEKYCFPCMRKILDRKRKESEKIVMEQEEKTDG